MSSKTHHIVFANEKGGTGKSTTAVHVAVALAYQGHKVAIIDLDPRQRTTYRYLENRDATMKRNKVAVAAADADAARVANIILPMRENGSTLQQIADALNTAKVRTPRNREWQAMSVRNALARLTVDCNPA